MGFKKQGAKNKVIVIRKEKSSLFRSGESESPSQSAPTILALKTCDGSVCDPEKN